MKPSHSRVVLALALLGAPTLVHAQTDHDRQVPAMAAVRREGAIALDGKLDEPAWQRATPLTGLRQYQPKEGEAASLPLELRIVYDEHALYIGARLLQPNGVVAPLARRDQLLDASGDNGSFNSLTTDKLVVQLDPYHNHLDNAWFEVNPAGAKGDQFNGDDSWDPVWDAATQVDAEGWTAELRIPFSQLRFARDSVQTWGMQVWRYIDRVNEQDMWSFRPRNASGGPSFYGHITGLRIPPQPRQMEILPYVVAGSRFSRAASADPYHDDAEPRLSAGADLKVLLTTNLTLDATLNPDFGQVEVDPATLNLSAFETYYDEKRPFFIAGASAFGFGGMRCMFCSNTSGLGAFYSRRIGRPPQLNGNVSNMSDFADTPENTSILGAAKITGRTSSGYTVGVLDAVTARETATYLPAGGGAEREQLVEPFTNYFVGRVKREFRSGATTFGGIVTSTLRQLDDPLAESILRRRAEAAGFDWNHTWKRREYSWMGSVLFTDVAGSPEAMTLTQRSSSRYFQRPDRAPTSDGLFRTRYDTTATTLRGYGLFTRVGKDNGKFLWEAMSNIRSPGFENNDLAFLGRTDFIWFNGNLGRQWTTPTSWYRSITIIGGGATQYNFEGDRTETEIQAFYGMELPNYWNIRAMNIVDVPSIDERLTRGGPAVKRRGYDVASLNVSTDARRTAVFDVEVQGAAGVGAPATQLTITPGMALKPAANVFIQFSPSWSRGTENQQYVRSVQDPTATAFYGSRYVFSTIRTTEVSLNTRVNWTFTPDMTLQLFAQPFIASGDYSRFREFAAPRSIDTRVYGEDMGSISYDATTRRYTVDPDVAGPAAPFSFGDPDFTTSALRGTAVLRWEYRPGSTVYLVWTQERSGYEPDGGFDLPGARTAILRQRPLNVFQVKATYWFGR